MTSTCWNGNPRGVGVLKKVPSVSGGGELFSGTTQYEVAKTAVFEHNHV